MEASVLGDSIGVEDWRQRESKELSELVQNRIHELQNPSVKQCISRQTILCNLTNSYGFSSGLSDIVWCLIAGYYSNRTVVLLSKRYHYLNEGSQKWTHFFQPLSDTCDESMFENVSYVSRWPGRNDPVTRRLIHYLPKSIGKRIVAMHSNPLVWWLGQFTHYIMRLQPNVQKILNDKKSSLGFSHPIVGLHVRRTDKIGVESSFHNVSEYMVHIKDFYDGIGLLNDTIERKVYLATDDPLVWRECVDNYPNYRFIGNQRAAVYTSKLKTRYNANSFLQLIIDIYLVSQTDYIVCTMSSGVCRVAYELMQNNYFDAGFKGQSIDLPFHYETAFNSPRVVIYNHFSSSDKQWSLRTGDMMYSRNGEDFLSQARNGKKYDSYYYGTDADKTDYRLYPAYKTLQKIYLF